MNTLPVQSDFNAQISTALTVQMQLEEGLLHPSSESVPLCTRQIMAHKVIITGRPHSLVFPVLSWVEKSVSQALLQQRAMKDQAEKPSQTPILLWPKPSLVKGFSFEGIQSLHTLQVT